MLRTVLAAVLLATGPATGTVTVETVKVNGSGCRPDTVAVALSQDKQAFTVLYSTYLAQAGAATKNKDERRTCSITVRLTVPPGVSYAIPSVDYRGFAHLEPGGSATLSGRYHFQGSGAPSSTVHSFGSGFDDDWLVTDVVGTSPVYSPCGKDSKVDIDTELRALADRDDAPTSYITMDSTDGTVAATYHLAFRSC
ncbi:DUF4360 domain-containing protein [Actinoplanes sp. NPDC049681]|uniref:DUF4360 domain-containing protein n=1 Tax=Actinoplanes sp. NPDC049681 TaxID=3363905 RepID=UPI0037B31018